MYVSGPTTGHILGRHILNQIKLKSSEIRKNTYQQCTPNYGHTEVMKLFSVWSC